ncbi:hypothetical protein V502_06575 [Pseudogymnoascus sp. VKM F-4520 (FW-2644)]|nr:hypothetical protein V502_06575 [Pseudogymnoascus sp. VKM F-4520 (FW-2644)]
MSGDNWQTDPSRDETPTRYVKGITSNWRQPTTSTTQVPNYATSTNAIHHMGTVPPHEFTPGRIACVWTFSEDRNNLERNQVDRSKEDLLTPEIPGTKSMSVFIKSRKFIVIARFVDHYVALPIYTHKGLGLASKIEMRGEFVSIRNKQGSDYYSESETEHGCIYTTTTAQEAGRRGMAPRGNVWFTSPQALSYRSRVTFLGKLDQRSISKLIELYMMATKNALSATLTGVHHSLWSDAPYSLGSEKRQRQADPESESQRSLENTTQPVNQTYSGATKVQTIPGATQVQTIPGAAQEQTYSGAVMRQPIPIAATGQTPSKTTGFQPLKRTQPPEALNEIPAANPAKRAKT